MGLSPIVISEGFILVIVCVNAPDPETRVIRQRLILSGYQQKRAGAVLRLDNEPPHTVSIRLGPRITVLAQAHFTTKTALHRHRRRRPARSVPKSSARTFSIDRLS